MSPLRKTRILYVNHTGLVSGAEKVLLNILRGIDRTRYEAFVLCPARGDLAAAVQAESIEWFPLPAINARFSSRPDHIFQSISPLFQSVAAMREQIRALDPDIVHANSVRAGIAASLAAAGTGKTVIWHVHDTLPRHPVSSAIRAFAFVNRTTRAIGVSQSTTQRFCGKLPFAERARTIYNGTDLRRFPLKLPGPSAFRSNIGITNREFLVCAVGQICARKGLLELVDALGRIRNEAPHMHLAIVGKVVFPHEGVYLEALRAAVVKSGLGDRVHFTGALSDPSPALQAADLLVLNSHDEPFGLVLIEAMSSGTPVVATRVGGVPEIVTDEENGWLIDKGDTAALALRLLKLSRDKEAIERAAQKGRTETCPKFSIERFHNELMSFYADLHPNLAPDMDRQWNARNRPALVGRDNH